MGARKHMAWALVLLCALALPAGARASTWLPPAFDVSTNGSDASEVQVAMDSAGDALAVWVRNGIVQSAFRPAGGTNSFGGATDMPGASTVASHLRLAMDGNGDAVAIWQTDGGRIEAAYMPQGSNGSFDGAQTLETDAANKPTTPDVAIDPAGDALAVWRHSDGANQRIEAVYAASGTFLATTPQVISPSGHDATSPSVGMDAAGDAQAVWLESDGANTRVQDAERPSGNASVFAALPPISDPGFDTANPRLAVSGGGAAMAVWEDTTNKSVVSAYTAALGATFGTPQTIELDATHPPALPAVAMNDNGDAQAVWQHFDTVSGKTRIEQRSAPGGTLAGTTVTVSGTSDDASNAQIAMDGAGDAIAVWAGSTPQIHAAQHISGQEFATATQANVSASGGGASAPSVAIDSAGDGIAGWQRSDGTNVLAQANGYDTGPQIPTLHVPTTPYAGHAVTLYAQGSDVWSPISTTTWNFGDGGTGNGPAVVHTYAAGSHTATATVTVADGLTQSANGSLTVATRPGPVFGGLDQVDAPNDCLSGQAGGCGTTLPFATGFGYEPVVSPDGRNVYYIALVGSIGEYARDESTGALTTIGCVTGNAVPGCTPINNAGLNGPAAAAFSPDGKNLYVATQGDQAVVTFSRDTSTGLLTFTGCIGEGGGSSCPTNTGKGIATPYGIVVSPDGKNVYVSSAQDQAVSEFDRNPSTGVLTQKASPNDCITALASGCGTINAPGLQATIGIAVSPDSANVYVLAGGTGGTGQGDIAEFSRSASTGVLSQLGGGNACLGAPGAPAGCATTATALQGIEDMALSPDGRFAYANSFITSSLVTLTRAANGALAQSDCISSQVGSPAGCSAYNVPGMQGPLGVAISPDADTVYVSGALANGEAAFERNSSTGHLTALPGPFNCITLDPSACGQSGASGLGGARRVAVSPDGKNVYVAGQNFGALSVLFRTAASDLGVGEAGAPASATTGTHFTYSYTVTEHGPSPANDAVLTVSPAANVSRGTLTTSQGSCSGATCHLGRIVSGSSATVRLPVTAAADGAATSGATVTPSEEVLDPNGANNTVHTTTTSLSLPKKVVPPPVVHKTGNVSPSKGTIKIKLPGSKRFVLLTTLRQIPFGSIIDATHGTVKVVVARRGGGTMTGYFSQGQFQITQARDGSVTLKLVGGNFKDCPVVRKRKHAPLAVVAKSARRRPKRKLFSNAHGNFTTQGGSASGSVRGTEWLTADYCDGTGITVYRDVVRVTNLHTHKSVNVRAGHSVFITKA